MRDFNSLSIWQQSHALTLKIYSVSHGFPKQETYGLTSQIRRSCSSIPTNIAEGCGRSSNVELRRFLVISSGSASELHYQLILAKDLNYISQPLYTELCEQLLNIRRMISSFIKNIPIT
jgi:four helix bundle protein